MQERKIEDSKIWEAYRRLIFGQSLSKVANSEDINLNRGTLRKYISSVVLPELEETEKNKFKQIMYENFRGAVTENRKYSRPRKKKALAEENLSDQIKELADLGVTGTQIEALYTLLRANKHTAYARDTFTFKCIEHFRFFEGIGIGTQEAFELFMRNPKAFTSDTRTLEERYLYLLRTTNSKEKAKESLLSNPRGKSKATDFNIKSSYTKTKDLIEGDLNNAEIDTGRGED